MRSSALPQAWPAGYATGVQISTPVTGPQPNPKLQTWAFSQLVLPVVIAGLSGLSAFTAGGVFWLVSRLPVRLDRIESRIEVLDNNQHRVFGNIEKIEGRMLDLDRRVVRLEVDD